MVVLTARIPMPCSSYGAPRAGHGSLPALTHRSGRGFCNRGSALVRDTITAPGKSQGTPPAGGQYVLTTMKSIAILAVDVRAFSPYAGLLPMLRL